MPVSTQKLEAAAVGITNDGEVELQHVLTVMLKQTYDSPLTKVLERGLIFLLFFI